MLRNFQRIQISPLLPPPISPLNWGRGVGRLVFLGGFTAQKHQYMKYPLPGKGGNRGDGNRFTMLESEAFQTIRRLDNTDISMENHPLVLCQE
jgi:hypothetical protein